GRAALHEAADQGCALPGDPRQPAAHHRRRERIAHHALRGDGGAGPHHARERTTRAARFWFDGSWLSLHGAVRGPRHRRWPVRQAAEPAPLTLTLTLTLTDAMKVVDGRSRRERHHPPNFAGERRARP